ncbi:MAG: DUF4169 family protein [Pseudomonadota bacterium]
MADTPINLNKARKARTKAAGKARAQRNRAKHGQPGAARRAEDARRALDGKKLDGHELGGD